MQKSSSVMVHGVRVALTMLFEGTMNIACIPSFEEFPLSRDWPQVCARQIRQQVPSRLQLYRWMIGVTHRVMV